MEIREAAPKDTEGIRTVHRKAITDLASADYTPEQIAAWTEPIESSDYESIEADEYYFIVAELDDEIVGFGSLRCRSPEGYEATVEGEITGVYVSPSAAREGVGSRLLAALEMKAQECNIRSLGLESSTNAVPFYEHHGYDQVRERTHQFGGRVEGAAVEMQKQL